MPQNIEEQEPESPNLGKHWEVVCRRRWWLAVPAFVIWAAVWLITWFLPATYRSETVILVEQQKVPEQYVVSNVAADLQERLQSMNQQILSRTRLLRIIDEFKLYPSLRTGASADDLVARMRKDIQIELVEAPHRRGDVTAFKIAYLSSNPHLAQKVTDQLTSFYIEENLKARQEQSEQTTEFLDSQLEEARTNLANQEARVRDFKSHYLGELPEQVQSNLQILSGWQARLQQETDALAQAKQRRVYLESLQNQWRSLESNLRIGRSAGIETPPALDQELDRLRAQLAELSSHYTERHPDIRKLKGQIVKTERMKKQMEQQVAAASQSEPESDATRPSSLAEAQNMSPRMEVESQLKANKLETENRERNIQQVQKHVEEYQARLNTTPVREQQLAGLTRDYEQSRKSYEGLLAKRDQSEMATNLEKLQKGEQFRVLDPPNLPQKPDSPNRLKLSLIGLIAGVVFGVGLTAGTEIMDDRVYCKEDFQKVITAPVLTEIPPLPTATEEIRTRKLLWLQSAVLIAMGLFTATGFAVTYLFG